MRNRIRAIPAPVRDLIVSIVIFLSAFVLCRLLSLIDNDNNPFAPQVFTLAVALISFFTRSYLPGVVCSVLGVLCVNVFFTKPFYHFNLSGLGYPTTFVVMLTVSILVSALTTRARREEMLRFEAETERIRGGLLRAISHDLRTPLTGIIGCSAALLHQPEMDLDQRRKLLGEIRSQALWLLRMTENILSVTRSQERVTLRKSDEAIEEVLSSAIRKFRSNTGSSLPVMIRSQETLHLVPMDAMLIEQVFVNLLENVERHAQGATHAEVRLEAHKDGVRITLSDDGCGIRTPPETAQSETDRGTGIGLMVCRSIIRAHGGTFDIQPSVQGTTAVITLPGEEGRQ